MPRHRRGTTGGHPSRFESHPALLDLSIGLFAGACAGGAGVLVTFLLLAIPDAPTSSGSWVLHWHQLGIIVGVVLVLCEDPPAHGYRRLVVAALVASPPAVLLSVSVDGRLGPVWVVPLLLATVMATDLLRIRLSRFVARAVERYPRSVIEYNCLLVVGLAIFAWVWYFPMAQFSVVRGSPTVAISLALYLVLIAMVTAIHITNAWRPGGRCMAALAGLTAMSVAASISLVAKLS